MEAEHRLFLDCIEYAARDERVLRAFNEANATQLDAAVVLHLVMSAPETPHREVSEKDCEDTFRFIVFVYGHIFRRCLLAWRRKRTAMANVLRSGRVGFGEGRDASLADAKRSNVPRILLEGSQAGLDPLVHRRGAETGTASMWPGPCVANVYGIAADLIAKLLGRGNSEAAGDQK